VIRAILVALVVMTGVASADVRVAVVGDKKLVAAAKAALEDHATVVAVKGSDPEKIHAAQTLTAVIVVKATSKRGDRAEIVAIGADGAVIARVAVKAKKAKMPKAIAARVWQRGMGEKLQAIAERSEAGTDAATATATATATETGAATGTATGTAAAAAAATGTAAAAGTGAGSATATGAAPAPAPPPAKKVASRRTDGGDGVRASTGVSERGASRRRVRRLDIAVEDRPFWRRLRYNDDLDDRMRPADLVANAVGVAIGYRPVRGTPGFVVTVAGELGVGIKGSRTSDGMGYGTSSSEWALGAGYQLSLGALRAGAAVAYGEHRFQVDDESRMEGELVPDVTYRYLRGGLTASFPVAPTWELSFAGGYRFLAGLGELSDGAWFPRTTGAGIDASAGITWRPARWFAMHARADLRRYFFAMNPEPGDPWIVGGASDQYLGLAVGLSISPL
jgi:hypothetical protein